MAKLTRKYDFSNADLSKDDRGRYILTEIKKDDSADYDLTSVLDSFVGLSGIKLSVSIDDGIPEAR